MDPLTALSAQFDPLRPLEAGETDLYVDWQDQLDIADDVKVPPGELDRPQPGADHPPVHRPPRRRQDDRVAPGAAAFPTARKEFRNLLQGLLPTIYDLTNTEILRKARAWLAQPEHGGYADIAIIVDQLDRIPRKQLNGFTNHENLFLDHAGALRALNCDLLYTIPIELAYSRAYARLQDAYGSEILALPAVPVSTRGGAEFAPGVAVLREIVRRRADKAGVGLDEVFAEPDLLDDVVRCSGGHIRGLFVLPLRTPDWELLAQVHEFRTKVGGTTASGTSCCGTGSCWPTRMRTATGMTAIRCWDWSIRAGDDERGGHGTRGGEPPGAGSAVPDADPGQRFRLGFVVANHPPLRSRITQDCARACGLRRREVTLDGQVPDGIVAQLERAVGADQPAALFVYGLESLLDLRLRQSPAMDLLNLNRDYCRQRFPWPVVFVAPLFAVREFARQAPDFWSGRTGVYRFTGDRDDIKETLAGLGINYDWSLAAGSKLERREILEHLQAELDNQPDEDPALTVELLSLLAQAAAFEPDWPTQQRLLTRALPVYRQIGARLGEANTLLSRARLASVHPLLRRWLRQSASTPPSASPSGPTRSRLRQPAGRALMLGHRTHLSRATPRGTPHRHRDAAPTVTLRPP